MILESIVTTVAADGQVNIAPMGPVVTSPTAMQNGNGTTDPGFVLRPFEGSRTFENLMATRCATIHVTDDAALFSRAAVGRIDASPSLVRMLNVADATSINASQTAPETASWAILRHCHRWFAVEVTDITESPPRYEMQCRVVDSAIEAPFFGFNRAKHAVIEAAILATRTHLIAADEVHTQLDALRPLIDKTAGQAERSAFESLVTEIGIRLKQNAASGAP